MTAFGQVPAADMQRLFATRDESLISVYDCLVAEAVSEDHRNSARLFAHLKAHPPSQSVPSVLSSSSFSFSSSSPSSSSPASLSLSSSSSNVLSITCSASSAPVCLVCPEDLSGLAPAPLLTVLQRLCAHMQEALEAEEVVHSDVAIVNTRGKYHQGNHNSEEGNNLEEVPPVEEKDDMGEKDKGEKDDEEDAEEEKGEREEEDEAAGTVAPPPLPLRRRRRLHLHVGEGVGHEPLDSQSGMRGKRGISVVCQCGRHVSLDYVHAVFQTVVPYLLQSFPSLSSSSLTAPLTASGAPTAVVHELAIAVASLWDLWARSIAPLNLSMALMHCVMRGRLESDITRGGARAGRTEGGPSFRSLTASRSFEASPFRCIRRMVAGLMVSEQVRQYRRRHERSQLGGAARCRCQVGDEEELAEGEDSDDENDDNDDDDDDDDDDDNDDDDETGEIAGDEDNTEAGENEEREKKEDIDAVGDGEGKTYVLRNMAMTMTMQVGEAEEGEFPSSASPPSCSSVGVPTLLSWRFRQMPPVFLRVYLEAMRVLLRRAAGLPRPPPVVSREDRDKHTRNRDIGGACSWSDWVAIQTAKVVEMVIRASHCQWNHYHEYKGSPRDRNTDLASSSSPSSSSSGPLPSWLALSLAAVEEWVDRVLADAPAATLALHAACTYPSWFLRRALPRLTSVETLCPALLPVLLARVRSGATLRTQAFCVKVLVYLLVQFRTPELYRAVKNVILPLVAQGVAQAVTQSTSTSTFGRTPVGGLSSRFHLHPRAPPAKKHAVLVEVDAGIEVVDAWLQQHATASSTLSTSSAASSASALLRAAPILQRTASLLFRLVWSGHIVTRKCLRALVTLGALLPSLTGDVVAILATVHAAGGGGAGLCYGPGSQQGQRRTKKRKREGGGDNWGEDGDWGPVIIRLCKDFDLHPGLYLRTGAQA